MDVSSSGKASPSRETDGGLMDGRRDGLAGSLWVAPCTRGWAGSTPHSPALQQQSRDGRLHCLVLRPRTRPWPQLFLSLAVLQCSAVPGPSTHQQLAVGDAPGGRRARCAPCQSVQVPPEHGMAWAPGRQEDYSYYVKNSIPGAAGRGETKQTRAGCTTRLLAAGLLALPPCLPATAPSLAWCPVTRTE